MKLKHRITALLLIAAINFSPAVVHAQTDGDGGITFGEEPPPDPDTDVPFDGGISLLVAAGVAYGIKKKYNDKKHSAEE